jgi:membrane-associated protease RseP (regulator of RpoE activity)
MLFMFVTLLLGAIVAVSIETEIVPPQNMLVLPGLNPIIPLWYGIFALAIAIILHEFTHGILARRVKMTIKSLGVLICVIPIGAFVEPDEKEMEKVNKRDRARIFAGGLTTNIIFGLIFAGIFSWAFMGSVTPVEDGVLIQSVTEDFPAEMNGIKPGMVFTEIQGVSANGTTIELVEIENREDFSNFMDQRAVNDTLNITVYYDKDIKTFNNITLADQYNHTGLMEDKGKGFLGVGGMDTKAFQESLARPVMSAGNDVNQRRSNLLYYFFILPTDLEAKIMPFHEPFTNAYKVEGPLSGLPTPLFWGLANVFYYLFWINILLGIFNALPAVPLDGGYVFKDVMHGFLRRAKPSMNEKRREAFINTLTVSFAFFILILLLMLLIGPYILKIIG